MASNRVESYLKSQLKKKNALLFVLIDSEVSDSTKATTLAKKVEKIGASAIFVGGSSASDQDRKSTRLNSSHMSESRMPSSA